MLHPLKKHIRPSYRPKLFRSYPSSIKVKDTTLYFEKKKLKYSLIHSLNKQVGFGLYAGKKLIRKLGLDLQTPLSSLPICKFRPICTMFDNMSLRQIDLRHEIREHFVRYQSFVNYKGWRHRNGLPVRGQRTRSNAKICRRLSFNEYIVKIHKNLLFFSHEMSLHEQDPHVAARKKLKIKKGSMAKTKKGVTKGKK